MRPLVHSELAAKSASQSVLAQIQLRTRAWMFFSIHCWFIL